jgi:glycosyltransferase involved in cell wall biosynthesis
MPFNMRKKRALYVQYTNPPAYPPLQHSSRILADGGWEVLFLGTHSPRTDSLEFPHHAHIRVKRLLFCTAGWRQKLHYFYFILWVFAWTLRWRPQWVYASDPLSAPAALIAGLFPGVCLLYHEHDSPSGRPSSAFMRWTLALRKRLARKADVIVLPNAQRAAVFARETGIDSSDVQCVWNCPAQADAQLKPDKDESGGIWLLFHGSIVPDRLPMSVLDAMADLPEAIKLRVIGYETVGSKGYMDQFINKAETLGLGLRLHFLGPLNRDDLLEWGRRSHIGIAFMPLESSDLNMLHMTGASNKPFDYLACGCPLLVSSLPDWDAMFVQTGLALSCKPVSPESIADAVRWYFEHALDRGAMGEAGRQRILREWNYENQFAPVRAKLEECVGCDHAH